MGSCRASWTGVAAAGARSGRASVRTRCPWAGGRGMEKRRRQVTSASRFVARIVHLAVAAGLAAGALFPPAVLAAWPGNARVLILSGVAGSSYNIGDVIVPDHWTDDLEHSAPPYPPYPVNMLLYSIARRRPGNVALDPNLYVEDYACTGLRSELSTPIRVEDPEL